MSATQQTAPEAGAAPQAAPPQASPATPPAPPQGAGDIDLFEGVEASTPAATPPAPGTRPDHIPEQFWDGTKNEPRIEAMAKSWSDLRKKVSQGIGAAPETADAYALPKIEGLTEEIIKPDDPLWKQVRENAHKAGVSQAQLEAIINPYIEDALARMKQVPAATPEAQAAALQEAKTAELQKLGPNGELMVRDIKGWIGGLQSRGSLTEAEARALLTAGNADGVRALAKLRALAGEKPIPLDSLAGDSMSLQDAQALMQQGFLDQQAGKHDQGNEKLRRAREALTQLEKRGLLSV